MSKTQRKSLPAHLTPGNPGNSGGKPGRSGRKPGWFKEFAASVLQDAKVQRAIKARAQDKKANGFWDGVKTLGHAAGEIQDKVQHEGEVTVRVTYDDD